MNRPLAEIVKDIKSTKPLAEENLETGHYTTLNARRGRQARAIETMKELNAEYIISLRKGTVFILAAGALKNEFTAMATEKYSCFSANPDAFYKELVKEIHPSMYRSGASNVFDILGRVIENKMLTLNVQSYGQPIFKAHYQRDLNNEGDVLQFVKDVVNEQVGGEIAGENAIQSLVPDAISKGHDKTTTVVILNTDDEKLTLTLSQALKSLTPFVFMVVAGKASKAFKLPGVIAIKEASVENVEAALKTVKDSVKRV